MKELERALEEAQGKVAAAQSGDLAGQARDVNGAKVLAARVQGDGKTLRELADKLRDKLGTGRRRARRGAGRQGDPARRGHEGPHRAS